MQKGEAVLTKLYGPYEVHFDEFHWQLVSRGAKSITRLAYCCTREGLLLRIRDLYVNDATLWDHREDYPKLLRKTVKLLKALPDRRADWLEDTSPGNPQPERQTTQNQS